VRLLGEEEDDDRGRAATGAASTTLGSHTTEQEASSVSKASKCNNDDHFLVGIAFHAEWVFLLVAVVVSYVVAGFGWYG
jgi:hypothetical protein